MPEIDNVILGSAGNGYSQNGPRARPGRAGSSPGHQLFELEEPKPQELKSMEEPDELEPEEELDESNPKEPHELLEELPEKLHEPLEELQELLEPLEELQELLDSELEHFFLHDFARGLFAYVPCPEALAQTAHLAQMAQFDAPVLDFDVLDLGLLE